MATIPLPLNVLPKTIIHVPNIKFGITNRV